MVNMAATERFSVIDTDVDSDVELRYRPQPIQKMNNLC